MKKNCNNLDPVPPEEDFLSGVIRLAAASGETGDIGIARIDHSRRKRCGFPEFVFGEGKTLEQLRRIIPELRKHSDTVLVTRLAEESGALLVRDFPEAEYDPLARTLLIRNPEEKLRFCAAVITAGTVDLPVALEAQHTLTACGIGSDLIADVGVANICRLLAQLDRIRRADVCIVAAGLEGALPSVVAGLVKTPVIAVPVSAGYGSAFHGVAPLLGMLNSCGSGVTVVNIDNGFGAACAASRILNNR